ncbi:MAG: phosphodiester glycosidase family protein [Candidatus Marinimicrobia bacterium]|nr:phosphodiester glycosidase family protein [Candidatus Neomarinimicrobiota bacterium]
MKACSLQFIILLPLLLVANDTWDHSVPNIAYLHRTTSEPWDIHVLIIDLKSPAVSIKSILAQDQVWGREVVSAMAHRHGAVAAINGDFCSLNNGIPQGITVMDNEIVIAPKYRTALGFTQNFSALIGMWTDRWNWYGKVLDEQGNEHDLVMMNLDVNQDWLCLFTDKYGHATPGSSLSGNVVEVLVNSDSLVQAIHHNQPGINIPANYYVLTGREGAANWLLNNIALNERLTLELTTLPDWRNLWESVSGGPRIVQNGQYYADPMVVFPGGEDFTMSYKNAYYNTRQPRSAAGTTINGDTLIFVVVDGRQTSSVGMTLQELASVLIEFGAVDALQFDSGGSATFFFNNSVCNSPADGSERAVANALAVFSSERYLNIAPEATVIAYSSELLDHPVTKLIDGNRSRNSGKWADTVSDTSWVELDLGIIKPVTHFQLFHAFYSGDPDYLNTKEYSIYTRTDTSQAWTEDFHVLNDEFQDRDNLSVYTVPNNIRYVRLEIIQSNHLDYEDILRQPEFEIYVLDSNWVTVHSEARSVVDYHLFQNYPNPFNPITTIQYELPHRSEVQITIYDLLGRKVTTLVTETQDAGHKSIIWDATNDHRQPVGAGVYFCQIRVHDPDAIGAGNFIKTRKIVLLK